MLYEFHRSQNAKRPGAVHATYLVYGTKTAADGPSARNGSDGDVEMASSAPEVESLAEVVPTSTLSLVPEEQLKGWLSAKFCNHLTNGFKKPLRSTRRLPQFTSTVLGLTRRRLDTA